MIVNRCTQQSQAVSLWVLFLNNILLNGKFWCKKSAFFLTNMTYYYHQWSTITIINDQQSLYTPVTSCLHLMCFLLNTINNQRDINNQCDINCIIYHQWRTITVHNSHRLFLSDVLFLNNILLNGNFLGKKVLFLKEKA